MHSLPTGSRSFEQAETLYRQGLISFLDVLDAQRVLAELEQRLAVDRTNYAAQIADLFRVLGTPVDLAPIAETHPPMEWDPSKNPDAPLR